MTKRNLPRHVVLDFAKAFGGFLYASACSLLEMMRRKIKRKDFAGLLRVHHIWRRVEMSFDFGRKEFQKLWPYQPRMDDVQEADDHASRLRHVEILWALNPIQVKVLDLVVRGFTNCEVAARLGKGWTENHVAHQLTIIYTRAGVPTTSGNRRMCLLLKFIDPTVATPVS